MIAMSKPTTPETAAAIRDALERKRKRAEVQARKGFYQPECLACGGPVDVAKSAGRNSEFCCSQCLIAWKRSGQ